MPRQWPRRPILWLGVLATLAVVVGALLSSLAPGADPAGMAVAYRVNAGGGVLDGEPSWSADTAASPSPHLQSSSEQFASTAETIELDASVPAGTPEALFRTERYDSSGQGLTYAFPVGAGSHEVRLYFAEIFPGAQQAGARAMDVLINGELVLDDYDTFADVGGYTGVMKSFTVEADDAVVVELRDAGADNPRIMGVEVLSTAPVPDAAEEQQPVTPPGEAPPEPVGQVIHALTEDTPLGEYTRAVAAGDFAPGTIEDGYWSYSDTAQVVPDPYGPGRALRITHPPQPSLTSGSLVNEVLNGKVSLPRDHDVLYLRYDLAFGDGFLFTNPLGAQEHYGGKLPGLAGGLDRTYAPVSCEEADADTGFSARQMWRHPNFQSRNGVVSPLMAYVYYDGKSNDCGDNYGYDLGERELQPNRYYRITQKVTITDPGEPNGRVEAWVDGVKVLDEGGFLFRDTDAFGINQLIFQSYFGGDEPSWGHPRVETQYYRDVRIFTGE